MVLFHLYGILKKANVQGWKTGPGAFRDWGKEVDYNGSAQANICAVGPVLYGTVRVDT